MDDETAEKQVRVNITAKQVVTFSQCLTMDLATYEKLKSLRPYELSHQIEILDLIDSDDVWEEGAFTDCEIKLSPSPT